MPRPRFTREQTEALEESISKAMRNGEFRILFQTAQKQEMIDITEDVHSIEPIQYGVDLGRRSYSWNIRDAPTIGWSWSRKSSSSIDLDAYNAALEELRANLTPEQKFELDARNHITVIAKSRRRYRLELSGLVREIDYYEFTRNIYCLQFWSYLPEPDQVLARMLLILADEELFLKTANNITDMFPCQFG